MASVTSRSFDRAAPYYDATRALPPAASAEVAALLARELEGRGRCLEVGVGTGRVALPLHDAGVPVTGLDLSRPMMDVLIGKAAGGQAPFPLVQGDATALPFPEGAFGAGLASHVFHLIPRWRDALGELQRVVRRGGLLLSDQGAENSNPILGEVRAKFRAELGAGAGHIGARHERHDVEQELVALAARRRPLPVVRAERRIALGRMIDSLEAGQWSWTWDVPAEARHAAAARTRAWAQDRLLESGSTLDDPLPLQHEVRWLAFDLP